MAAIEEAFEWYAEPPEPNLPKVTSGLTPTPLISEIRQPLPTRPGQPERYGNKCHRNGICQFCMFFDPEAGLRHYGQRTKPDCAHPMNCLTGERYPPTAVICMVVDTSNPHQPAALVEARPSDEARRWLLQLESHYSPKRGK